MSVARRELLMSEFGTWGYDERAWSPRTREKYAWRIRALEAWLQEHKHKSILWASAKDLKAWLFSTPPNASTRNNYRQAVVAFYAFLVDREYVDVNHGLGLPRLKQAKSLPKALSDSQAFAVERAAKSIGLLEETLVLVYLYLAVRMSGGRLLEWSRLDLSDPEDAWVRYTAKGGDEKGLPIPPKVVRVLLKWREECPSPRWVFPSPYRPARDRARSTGWVRNVITKVGEEAGVPGLHPHMLRHTWATRAVRRGIDVRVVQEVLGHASLQSTQIYLSVRPENLRDAIDSQDYPNGSLELD